MKIPLSQFIKDYFNGLIIAITAAATLVIIILAFLRQPTYANVEVSARQINFTLIDTTDNPGKYGLPVTPLDLAELRLMGFRSFEIFVSRLFSKESETAIVEDTLRFEALPGKKAFMRFSSLKKPITLHKIDALPGTDFEIILTNGIYQFSFPKNKNFPDESVFVFLAVSDTFEIDLHQCRVTDSSGKEVIRADGGKETYTIVPSRLALGIDCELPVGRGSMNFSLAKGTKDRIYLVRKLKVAGLNFWEKNKLLDSTSTTIDAKIEQPSLGRSSEFGKEYEFKFKPETIELDNIFAENDRFKISFADTFSTLQPEYKGNKGKNPLPTRLEYYFGKFPLVMILYFLGLLQIGYKSARKVQAAIMNRRYDNPN